MVNVFQVISDTNIGGAGRYLLNYLKYFDREKFCVSVVLPKNSRLKEFISAYEDVRIFEAPYMADKSFDKKCVAYLKQIFVKEKPDIVHTHASLSARVAAKAARVKKVIATRHCIEENFSKLKTAALGLINNSLCDIYIAVSDAVSVNLKESGVSPQKIRVVANGVEAVKPLDLSQINEIKKDLGIKNFEIVFGVFARLEKIKGHRFFIKAAKRVIKEGYKAKFLIVGDGAENESLKELVRHYNLEEHVLFTGYVKDTTRLLNAVDVNVISSYSEAMSLALLEAMSLSKPSIATKVGGNPQVVRNNESGILVNVADSSSLAEAMIKILEDNEFYKLLAENAGNDYKKLYTAEIMVKNLEKIYLED